MTEQLRINGAFRNGAAVDGEVRAVFADAVLVDYLRKHVLTGATLSVDEHGEVGGSNLNRHFNGSVQVRIVADNAESLLNRLNINHLNVALSCCSMADWILAMVFSMTLSVKVFCLSCKVKLTAYCFLSAGILSPS